MNLEDTYDFSINVPNKFNRYFIHRAAVICLITLKCYNHKKYESIYGLNMTFVLVKFIDNGLN